MEVSLAWTDNSFDEDGFTIERSADGLNFVFVDTVAANVSSFVDRGLPDGAYAYRVSAFNVERRSDYTNVALFRNRPASRLANVSVRAPAGMDSQSLILGFVISGASKPILLRAAGPGLASLLAAPSSGDPRMALFDGSTAIMQNDNWGGGEILRTAFSRVGAFPFASTSKDAALFTTLAPKGYTAQITSSATAICLAEIYDMDAPDVSVGRLVNLSARTSVGTGVNNLVAGFVVSGESPMQVLIRAVGPELGSAGITGVLAAPQLDVYRGTTRVGQSARTIRGGVIADATSRVGAFALPAASKDAALILTLLPGVYSAVVSGDDGTSGIAMVELYELP